MSPIRIEQTLQGIISTNVGTIILLFPVVVLWTPFISSKKYISPSVPMATNVPYCYFFLLNEFPW